MDSVQANSVANQFLVKAAVVRRFVARRCMLHCLYLNCAGMMKIAVVSDGGDCVLQKILSLFARW